VKASQASTTAKVIAASTVLLASCPADQALVPAGAAALCRHFLSTNRADRYLGLSVSSPWTRWLWRCLERLTHPGIIRHYLLRKRWIEEQSRLALRQGVGRVIIIGAGLDTLALRLASQYPEVAWLEIDHPATQDFKRQGLAHAGLQLPANFSLLSVDLSTAPLPAALMRDTRPTLVVIEGVLMYLTEADVAALLRDQVRTLSLAPVHLIFSHMVRWPQGPAGFRPNSWWVDRWLAWRDEPFQWTMPPQALKPWLQSLGFALLRNAEPPFTEEAAEPSDCLKGENLVMCVAEQADRPILAPGRARPLPEVAN
jgi:methyltransferase (TIGR00027 family)